MGNLENDYFGLGLSLLLLSRTELQGGLMTLHDKYTNSGGKLADPQGFETEAKALISGHTPPRRAALLDRLNYVALWAAIPSLVSSGYAVKSALGLLPSYDPGSCPRREDGIELVDQIATFGATLPA